MRNRVDIPQTDHMVLGEQVSGGVSERDVLVGRPPSRAGSLPHWVSGFTRDLWSLKIPVGAGLLAMALYQEMIVLWVYISVAAVTASGGSALTAGHLEKPQVTKGSCP